MFFLFGFFLFLSFSVLLGGTAVHFLAEGKIKCLGKISNFSETNVP